MTSRTILNDFIRKILEEFLKKKQQIFHQRLLHSIQGTYCNTYRNQCISCSKRTFAEILEWIPSNLFQKNICKTFWRNTKIIIVFLENNFRNPGNLEDFFFYFLQEFLKELPDESSRDFIAEFLARVENLKKIIVINFRGIFRRIPRRGGKFPSEILEKSN